MLGITPYLSFNGNCKEAIDFYVKCLNGQVLFSQTYGESPMDRVGMSDKIMHTSFQIGDAVIMACDTPAEQGVTTGSNISLALGSDDIPAAENMFNEMGEGGTVLMPMQETFWAARFGVLTDKFGITWLFNCDQPKEQEQPQERKSAL
jgi:PhnB protein